MARDALAIVTSYFPDVEKVVDATHDALIEVKAADERAADRRKHRTCALAVACKRAFKLDGVIISVSTAYLVRGTVATRYHFPPSVAREITSFDRGSAFEPGVYKLNKIRGGNRLGERATRQRGKRGVVGNGAARSLRHLTGGIRTVLGVRKSA